MTIQTAIAQEKRIPFFNCNFGIFVTEVQTTEVSSAITEYSGLGSNIPDLFTYMKKKELVWVTKKQKPSMLQYLNRHQVKHMITKKLGCVTNFWMHKHNATVNREKV